VANHLPGLIGVIHLPALAGAPRSHGLDPAQALARAGSLAVKEAQALTRAGFQGIVIENFGDAPFYKTKVPAETIASMAVIAGAVREATRLPIGINVLRNDALSALAIAAVTGCDFIRVNVISGVAATDQGLIEGDGATLLRERDRLHAPVAILADAHVKHAQSLSSTDIGLGIEEVALRSLADGVIVTGSTTGRAVDLRLLERASQICRAHRVPLYVGSGATCENLAEMKSFADGVIVGSALRRANQAGAPLDQKRLKEFVKAYRATGRKNSKKR